MHVAAAWMCAFWRETMPRRLQPTGRKSGHQALSASSSFLIPVARGLMPERENATHWEMAMRIPCARKILLLLKRSGVASWEGDGKIL